VQTEKVMSLGSLAAGIAHEINNPLAGVIQSVAVLNNRLTSEDIAANRTAAEDAGIDLTALRRYLDARKIGQITANINASAQQAAVIVANMLAFSRKSGKARKPQDIEMLLEQIVSLSETDFDLNRHYDFKHLRIVRNYQSDLPLVMCDGNSIQQVFLNVLRNSADALRDYKSDEPPSITLRTSYLPDRELVRVEISDNGPGVDIVSEPGQGATFIIELPVSSE
jgi:signal transduction histidine kinase